KVKKDQTITVACRVAAGMFRDDGLAPFVLLVFCAIPGVIARLLVSHGLTILIFILAERLVHLIVQMVVIERWIKQINRSGKFNTRNRFRYLAVGMCLWGLLILPLS